MTWATWLMGLAGSLAARVLLSLGFGIISYAAVATALSAALGAAKASIGGMVPDVANLIGLAGFFTALSIIAGGAVASVSLLTLKRLALKVGA